MRQIDFDNFDKHDKKLKDWRLPKETDWSEVRMRFTDEKPDLMNYFNIPRFDVPELMRSAEDGKKYRDVWYNVSTILLYFGAGTFISFCLIRLNIFFTQAPGMEYALGYNARMGDTGILTKNKMELRNNL